MVDDLLPPLMHFVYEVFGIQVLYISAFIAAFTIIMLLVMMIIATFFPRKTD